MNEPQLSAEMKKRFSKIMLEWIESQWKIEQAHQNGEPYTRMKFEADANEVENRLKHFLATALEEQKTKIIKSIVEAGGFVTESRDGKTEVEYKVDPVRTTVGFKGITI